MTWLDSRGQRSKVKVTVGCRYGEGIDVDARASKSIFYWKEVQFGSRNNRLDFFGMVTQNFGSLPFDFCFHRQNDPNDIVLWLTELSVYENCCDFQTTL